MDMLQRRRWRWALKKHAFKGIHSQSVSQVAFVQVLATAVARIEATPVASACYSAALAANETWMEKKTVYKSSCMTVDG
jgi:hypothetical protein